MSEPKTTTPSGEVDEPVLAGALRCAAWGWFVLPLHGLRANTTEEGELVCTCKKGSLCRDPGKHPRMRGWKEHATANQHVVPSRFRIRPSNLGVATGRRSGLIVVDLDPRHGSHAALVQLRQERGALPSTLTARTGGGGEHLYYRWPTGLYAGNGLPALHGYPGIDVRGQGGLVVVAPSLHKSGGSYEWMDGPDEPAPLPDWCLEGLTRDLSDLPCPNGITQWAWSALVDECNQVASARRGRRNDTLFKAACRIGEIIAGQGLGKDVASDLLAEAAAQAGLGQEEIAETLASGVAKGEANPRRPPPTFAGRTEALDHLGLMRAQLLQEGPEGKGWPGHKGKRMFVVLEGMIRIAMRAGGPGNFAAGLRRIAVESGVGSLSTVHRAIAELKESGIVVCLYPGDVWGLPSRWRLRIPPTTPFFPSPEDSPLA